MTNPDYQWVLYKAMADTGRALAFRQQIDLAREAFDNALLVSFKGSTFKAGVTDVVTLMRAAPVNGTIVAIDLAKMPVVLTDMEGVELADLLAKAYAAASSTYADAYQAATVKRDKGLEDESV